MKLFNNGIIELPKGLSETKVYKLLSLFDQEIIANYQFDFNRSDEYQAVLEGVKYFYKNPERTEEGLLDEEANKIDIEYLTMLIMSGKMTRNFLKTLLNREFNIDSNLNDFLTIDPSSPYEIVLHFQELAGKDTSNTLALINKMFNHLLYYHKLTLIIETFIQLIEVELKSSTTYKQLDLNAIYYEQYQ